MAKLYIMCGLPFAGKTTLAKRITEFTKSELVSFDSVWRDNPNLHRESKEDEWKLVRKAAQAEIGKELHNGRSVVYDDINVRQEHRNELRQLAKDNNAESIVVFANTPLEKIKRREKFNEENLERHKVESVNFENALNQFEPPQASENVIEYNPSMEMEAWLKKNFRN